MFSKKILNVIYEIDELVCSKSSKSSLSTDTMEGAEDWLFREKEAQTTKEIYKLNE